MTQQVVADWYRSVGGRANALRAAQRIREEVNELILALEAGELRNARIEAADVGLCLLVAADIIGCDLNAHMDAKHQINLRRHWRVTEDGVLYHIRPASERSTDNAVD